MDAKRIASTLLRQVDEWVSPAFKAAFAALDAQRAELEALRQRVEQLERQAKPEDTRE
jgi:hypothetical protein